LSTVIDVTEQRRAEEEQRKSEQLFRDLFEINPVGTIVTNPEGTIYLVNPAFVNASGYAFDEMVGKTVHELGFWKNEEDRRQMLAAIKDKGYLDNLEATMYGNHGKQFVCLISSRLIEFGGEVRILNLVTDITEQRAAEETLRRIEKAKSDFISIAAHELRTPLIAVIGYCELLQNATQGNISDEQREEYLEVVQSNAETLNRLVDDLLDIGRIQIGRTLGVSPQETDLLSLVEKTVASVKLRSGSHEIIIKKAEGLPEKVWLDPGRIAQVLYNLLSNAIKFSPDGGIIQVHLESFQNHLSVSVVDRGLGMNEEEIENIFDRFYRGDKGSAESPGLGLGLSIVKQIITDHGGDIQVESQPGKGTTVKFSLPVET
ncbi:PAS domain S-box protein, partial [candidate division KSB1 bacterium]|nr:PAS domain-containing sensor histidine kinase [candidate division KSB1 bacterium]NIW22241.1 PAS domain S-box protein [candidate division KSB1 bacterium]